MAGACPKCAAPERRIEPTGWASCDACGSAWIAVHRERASIDGAWSVRSVAARGDYRDGASKRVEATLPPRDAARPSGSSLALGVVVTTLVGLACAGILEPVTAAIIAGLAVAGSVLRVVRADRRRVVRVEADVGTTRLVHRDGSITEVGRIEALETRRVDIGQTFSALWLRTAEREPIELLASGERGDVEGVLCELARRLGLVVFRERAQLTARHLATSGRGPAVRVELDDGRAEAEADDDRAVARRER